MAFLGLSSNLALLKGFYNKKKVAKTDVIHSLYIFQ